MESSHPEPAQRAADVDRDAAADAVRLAGGDGRLTVEEMEHRLSAVFAAKTHTEIDALLADLRGRQGLATTGQSQQQPAYLQSQRPSGPETHRTLTIMSDSKRRGFWRPAAESQVITVMGDSTIDLTDADLSRPVTHMRVFTLMGSTRIEVPDDVNVHVTKLTIMAENDIDAPDAPPMPGAPELHIHLVSIMGECKLRFRRTRGRRNELYA
jgi:hypothetical protein